MFIPQEYILSTQVRRGSIPPESIVNLGKQGTLSQLTSDLGTTILVLLLDTDYAGGVALMHALRATADGDNISTEVMKVNTQYFQLIFNQSAMFPSVSVEQNGPFPISWTYSAVSNYPLVPLFLRVERRSPLLKINI